MEALPKQECVKRFELRFFHTGHSRKWSRSSWLEEKMSLFTSGSAKSANLYDWMNAHTRYRGARCPVFSKYPPLHLVGNKGMIVIIVSNNSRRTASLLMCYYHIRHRKGLEISVGTALSPLPKEQPPARRIPGVRHELSSIQEVVHTVPECQQEQKGRTPTGDAG